MQPHIKIKLRPGAFNLYLLGGVAGVFALLSWLWPGQPPEPMPTGRLEQSYREEIAALVGEQPGEKCWYEVRHMAIACDRLLLRNGVLHDRGWKVVKSSEKSNSFGRDKWLLSLQCLPQDPRFCTARISITR